MGSLSARRTPENSTPQHYAIVLVHGERWQFPEEVNGKAQGDPDTLMPSHWNQSIRGKNDSHFCLVTFILKHPEIIGGWR